MAFKLKDTLDKVFDDRVVGQMGALLGENERDTRRGLAAVVPTLWRSLMAMASSDDGIRMLETELDRQDDRLLKNYEEQLHFNNSRRLVEKGSDLFGALAGSQAPDVLATVGRSSGLTASGTRTMMGMVLSLIHI